MRVCWHTLDRFYVVTKFILLSIGDLNFSTLNYDNTCAYLEIKNICNTDSKKHMLDLMTFCKKIEPFVLYYKRLIKSYNNTAHNYPAQQINAVRKLNANVWCLYFRNAREAHQHCTPYTQHKNFTREIICRTTKLTDTQITLCKCARFTTLFHKFITLFKNSAR